MNADEVQDELVPALAPGVRLQTDRVTGQPMLLSSEGILVLNSTAHEIVQRCDGTATVMDIASALGKEYDADPADLSGDIRECVSALISKRLLEIRR